MSDIEVDTDAVRRLAGAASQVSRGMTALHQEITAAVQLPGGTFGRIPPVSQILELSYLTRAGSAATMFQTGEEAFGSLSATLNQVADAYDGNEAELARSFAALLGDGQR